jgi:hypothetical protein
MRVRARGIEPSSNWVRRLHVPGYIWRARVWGSSRFLAKFRSSDRISRERRESRRGGGGGLRGAQGCDEGEQGEETPRRAVSSSLLGFGGPLGSSPSRVRFGCICPSSRAGPRTGFCFSGLTLRLSSHGGRWIPIRRLLVRATGSKRPDRVKSTVFVRSGLPS